MIYRYWIVLLYACVNLSFALDVQLVKKYYFVDPEQFTGITHSVGSASIIDNKSIGLHAVASYSASVAIKMIHVQNNLGMCHTDKFELQLNGVMMLPKLKMGNYLLTTRQNFDEEYLRLQQHEYEHEAIWESALLEFEQNIRALKINDNNECGKLIDEINQKMAITLSDIIQKNIQFDCTSYGYRLGLKECTSK